MMKKIPAILCIAAILIWWEAPVLTVVLTAVNSVIVLKNYSESSFYKIIIASEFAALVLAIWNWNLDVGMNIVEKFADFV